MLCIIQQKQILQIIAIKISLGIIVSITFMADSLVLPKSPLNIQSTQQALNMLRNLRQKRKKQNPASIYQLVKTIYTHIKQNSIKKGSLSQTISSQQYLSTNRESIQQMLAYIKNKIIDGDFNNKQQIVNQNKNQLQQLKISVSIKQAQIQKLNQIIKSSDQQAKYLQIKLLNNVKRINLQLQQKDTQLANLKKIFAEKQADLEQLAFLNEKQYKKIRKLQEDLYDIQMELQEKNQQLQAQKQCADFLQKKVGKLFSKDSQIIQQNQQHNQTIIQSQYQQIYPLKSQNSHSNLLQSQKQQKQTIGTQTQSTSPFSSQSNSEQNNQCQNQQDNEDQLSQNSSILTQSKQSKYIESIQRLTLELGQAYNRINELIKSSDNIQGYQQNSKNKSIYLIKNQHVRQDVDQDRNRGKSIVNQHVVNKGRNKSRSGYFSKFWQ